MSGQPKRPYEFHAGSWEYEANRPIVDGKIEDPVTGQVRPTTKDTVAYAGPPNVDSTVMNIHENSAGVSRFQRPFPRLLAHIMKIVDREGISPHALNATSYSITIVLVEDLEEKSGLNKIALEMANGI